MCITIEVFRNDTRWMCCNGYMVDLLKKLSQDIGFTFFLYRVPDGLFGRKERGVWNGVVGELERRRADMAATSLSINSHRVSAVDFSLPFLKTGISIVVKLRRGAVSHTAFLKPFEYDTWVMILCVTIQVAAVSIWTFEWLSPLGYDRGTALTTEGHRFSLMRSFWLVWATVFSASVETDVPRSHTGRIVTLVWGAFSLIFVAIYISNLAAFMITLSEYHDISGIDDPKLQNPRKLTELFTYGTVKGGNTDQTLEQNYRAQYRKLDAFIYDAVTLNYQAGKDDNCEILTVGKWFSRTGFGLAFPKKSPLRRTIDQYILKYQNNGFLERLQKFWLIGACNSKKPTASHSLPLGIGNFFSVFMLLSAGGVAGFLFLCLEFFYCIYLRKILQRWDKKQCCGIFSLSIKRSLTYEKDVEKRKCIAQIQKDLDICKSEREVRMEEKLSRAREQLSRVRTQLRHLGGPSRQRSSRPGIGDIQVHQKPTSTFQPSSSTSPKSQHIE